MASHRIFLTKAQSPNLFKRQSFVLTEISWKKCEKICKFVEEQKTVSLSQLCNHLCPGKKLSHTAIDSIKSLLLLLWIKKKLRLYNYRYAPTKKSINRFGNSTPFTIIIKWRKPLGIHS